MTISKREKVLSDLRLLLVSLEYDEGIYREEPQRSTLDFPAAISLLRRAISNLVEEAEENGLQQTTNPNPNRR